MTCFKLDHYLLMTCIRHAHNLFTIFHNLFRSFGLVHDLLLVKIQIDPDAQTNQVVDLSMTCSILVYRTLSTISSWLGHNLLQLVHNFFMTCSRLFHNMFMICLKLVHDFFITCSGLVNNFITFFSWLVHDIIIFSWLIHYYFITCSQLLDNDLFTSFS